MIKREALRGQTVMKEVKVDDATTFCYRSARGESLVVYSCGWFYFSTLGSGHLNTSPLSETQDGASKTK